MEENVLTSLSAELVNQDVITDRRRKLSKYMSKPYTEPKPVDPEILKNIKPPESVVEMIASENEWSEMDKVFSGKKSPKKKTKKELKKISKEQEALTSLGIVSNNQEQLIEYDFSDGITLVKPDLDYATDDEKELKEIEACRKEVEDCTYLFYNETTKKRREHKAHRIWRKGYESFPSVTPKINHKRPFAKQIFSKFNQHISSIRKQKFANVVKSIFTYDHPVVEKPITFKTQIVWRFVDSRLCKWLEKIARKFS